MTLTGKNLELDLAVEDERPSYVIILGGKVRLICPCCGFLVGNVIGGISCEECGYIEI